MSTDDVKFPVYRIVGGPSSRDLEIWRNGEKLRATTDFQITGSVNGMVKVTITEYAKLDGALVVVDA